MEFLHFDQVGLGFDLAELIKTIGYIGIFFMVFAESGLFFGFFCFLQRENFKKDLRKRPFFSMRPAVKSITKQTLSDMVKYMRLEKPDCIK